MTINIISAILSSFVCSRAAAFFRLTKDDRP